MVGDCCGLPRFWLSGNAARTNAKPRHVPGLGGTSSALLAAVTGAEEVDQALRRWVFSCIGFGANEA